MLLQILLDVPPQECPARIQLALISPSSSLHLPTIQHPGVTQFYGIYSVILSQRMYMLPVMLCNGQEHNGF